MIYKRTVQTLLVLILLGNGMLLPALYVELRDYFDPLMREVNDGHFSLHISSLIFHAALATLPLFTLLSLLGYRHSSLLCLAIIAYVPIYFIYGNYIAAPRGFHASHLHIATIVMASGIVGFIFGAHWILSRKMELRSDIITKDPQPET